MTSVKIKYLGDMRTQCTCESGAMIETDAPKSVKGRGIDFSPTDLFAASIGSCMLTLMEIVSQKMGINLGDVNVEVKKKMVSTPKRRVGEVLIQVSSSYSPSAEEKQKLEQAAIDCPVHLSLHPEIRVELNFTWGN